MTEMRIARKNCHNIWKLMFFLFFDNQETNSKFTKANTNTTQYLFKLVDFMTSKIVEFYIVHPIRFVIFHFILIVRKLFM